MNKTIAIFIGLITSTKAAAADGAAWGKTVAGTNCADATFHKCPFTCSTTNSFDGTYCVDAAFTGKASGAAPVVAGSADNAGIQTELTDAVCTLSASCDVPIAGSEW